MAKLALTENSLSVLNYLKENTDKDLTAADIAINMGFADKDDEESVKAGVKKINGIVTAGLQKKGYTQRIPATAELPDGTSKPIKLIVLTDEGKAYDHEAAIKADAEAAAKAE